MASGARDETYRIDWEQVRNDWPAWAVLAGSFLAGILLYPHLPDRVPIHWNAAGEVDGYGSKVTGAFVLPAVNVGIYALMLFLPLIDPKRANYPRFGSFYRTFRVLLVLFFGLVHAVALWAALGRPVDVGLVISIAVSLLFLYLGSSLGRVQHNYFVGIRTPWTLANEEVWRRTHRMGGRLFVLAALAPWAAWPFSRTAAFLVLVGAVMAAAVASAVYSAVLYHRVTRP